MKLLAKLFKSPWQKVFALHKNKQETWKCPSYFTNIEDLFQ